VAVAVGSRRALSTERTYVGRVLPTGIMRGLRDAARGDCAGIQRAAAIITGFSLACGGYAYGRIAGVVLAPKGAISPSEAA